MPQTKQTKADMQKRLDEQEKRIAELQQAMLSLVEGWKQFKIEMLMLTQPKPTAQLIVPKSWNHQEKLK